MKEINNQMANVVKKNRVAKILLLILIAVIGIKTIQQQGIFESFMCWGLFMGILISNPYHGQIKNLKRRMKIETSFHDSIK